MGERDIEPCGVVTVTLNFPRIQRGKPDRFAVFSTPTMLSRPSESSVLSPSLVYQSP